MTMPLVTCITPTYGRFELLSEMLWCWLHQDYPNKELIIVNDQENLIINGDFPGVTIINHPTRFVGLGAKRNFAIQYAGKDSEFICPFDDDDLFFPEHISFLVTNFIDDTVERTKNSKHWVSIDNSHFNISHDLGETYFGASCFRKKVFEEYRLKDYLTMGEDADLFEQRKLKMIIADNPLSSSFIHRRGMGIPHASSLRAMSFDPQAQKEINEGMAKGVRQYAEPTIRELVPGLIAGKSLYERVNEHRYALVTR